MLVFYTFSIQVVGTFTQQNNIFKVLEAESGCQLLLQK